MKLVMTGLMMALIMVATMFLKIPTATGYVHFGDAVIFLSVLVLGYKYGALAAGLGSAMADLISGYGAWAPWTLLIKAAMAIIMGAFIAYTAKKQKSGTKGTFVIELVGMVVAGIVMVAGYYLVHGFMYGNWITAMAQVPWDSGQFIFGLLVAGSISAALYKTPAKKFFVYRRK
jgi:uncharacterized membrane protein